MHRSDLTYLLDMMGSEIAIGHSYVRGGALPEIPPSPGGLLGADFAIGNGRYIAPRGGFFTRDGKWPVENEGVAPDIDIENFPKEVIAGRDPQLERAVAEALRMLKEKPVDRLMKEPAPPTWGRRKIG